MGRANEETAGKRKQLRWLERRQWFCARTDQLLSRGFTHQSIRRDLEAGRLYLVHRGVYSTIAPDLLPVEGHHAAAILLGGKGAALCSWSSAWWQRLSRSMPQLIHVAVRDSRRPANGIRWHQLDLSPTDVHKPRRMPCTIPQRVPLDLAPEASVWELKGVLAELEFHHGIGPDEVIVRPGYAGTRKLRQAIAEHTPQLAETASQLEDEFLRLLVEEGFVLPRFNRRRGLATVDADFADYGVVVELDGLQGHSGERRILRDHRRDLHRRAEGKRVLRYHYAQLLDPHERTLVVRDLELAGIPRIADLAA